MKIDVVSMLFPLCLLVALSLFPSQARAEPEAFYVSAWCDAANGTVEAVLQDGTRADCLTYTHAVEFDFGPKWAEALGQSLHYARLTGKRPGIVLILDPGQDRFLHRLQGTVTAYGLPVDVWPLAVKNID